MFRNLVLPVSSLLYLPTLHCPSISLSPSISLLFPQYISLTVCLSSLLSLNLFLSLFSLLSQPGFLSSLFPSQNCLFLRSSLYLRFSLSYFTCAPISNFLLYFQFFLLGLSAFAPLFLYIGSSLFISWLLSLSLQFVCLSSLLSVIIFF